MLKIKVIIEQSADGHYWAHADNAEGINGEGSTIDKVKKSVLECIETQKELGNFKVEKYKVLFVIEE